jgi:hypothetical protein
MGFSFAALSIKKFVTSGAINQWVGILFMFLLNSWDLGL